MSLGFQIRGCYQYCGGHNLPPLIGIGLTELQKSGGAKAPLAPPLTTALVCNCEFINILVPMCLSLLHLQYANFEDWQRFRLRLLDYL